MTRVGRRFHGLEPSERPRSGPHPGGPRLVAPALLALLATLVGVGCGGGPDASVGVTTADGDVVVVAKACGDGGIARLDVVDPTIPDTAIWRATLEDGPARRRIPVVGIVAGYQVDGADETGDLPDRRLRVLVEGTDGTAWGGPRFTPSELEEGTLRVAGQDVALTEWQDQPARCGDAGLAAVLVGGLATAAVAAALWLAVRGVAWALRVRPRDGTGPGDGGPGRGGRDA